ncbi:hypothetical protein BH09ACT12_BH09ACT12_01290 [soil metagenome]
MTIPTPDPACERPGTEDVGAGPLTRRRDYFLTTLTVTVPLADWSLELPE